jgi:hypothetical protein
MHYTVACSLYLVIPTGDNMRPSSRPEAAYFAAVVEGPPHFAFAVVCSFCLSFRSAAIAGRARVYACRIEPSLYVFASSIAPAIEDAKIFPQKPQQIPLSSPSTPKNPANHHPINHIPPKNSWHSSYAPSCIIEVVEKTREARRSCRASLICSTAEAKIINASHSLSNI